MIKISDVEVDNYSSPFIIAEMSGNHNGSIEKAKKCIKAAKIAGAHAVKMQTYTPETMTINSDKSDFVISGGLWDGYKLYDLYREAHTPYEWHSELFSYAREIDVAIFSTPFDESAVDLLEKLNVPAYKVASFELTDLPLLKYVAATGKPILLSTGMASEEEISESVDTLLTAGCEQLLLFHCISSYPAPTEQSNLRKIETLRRRFNLPVGLSDHTLSNTAAIESVALGAAAIEKHFTLSRCEKGPDSEFSLEPSELKQLVDDARSAWLALGDGGYARAEVEGGNKVFRRSLYFVRDLKVGSVVSRDDVRRIRPGYGLNPKYFDLIIGKKILKNVECGDPVTIDCFDKFDLKV